MNEENNTKEILEIVNFIKDNVATKEDLKDFATKEDLKDFATKNDLSDMKEKIREDFSLLQTSVDRLVKRMDDYFSETKALQAKTERLEEWILLIAEKVDIKLPI